MLKTTGLDHNLKTQKKRKEKKVRFLLAFPLFYVTLYTVKKKNGKAT